MVRDVSPKTPSDGASSPSSRGEGGVERRGEIERSGGVERSGGGERREGERERMGMGDPGREEQMNGTIK